MFMYASSRAETLTAPSWILTYLFRRSILGALLFALVAVWVRDASAQQATGDVIGTVTDSSGAVLPSATLRLVNSGTQEIRTFQSASDGAYSFSLLQPGTYVLTIDAAGFKEFRSTGIALAGGDRLRIDAKLQIGAAGETVEVTAQASALQTDSTNVGSTVTEKSIADLPLNGRNFFNLVQVQPGINAGSPTSFSGGSRITDRRQSSSVSANGQNDLVNDELIDGLDNNERYLGAVVLRPSVEAIEQVRTDTNLYTADVGRSAGAVINVLTKAGSNDFHGSVYEYFRNDITDTRNFFAPASVLARKPPLRQNQFGASLGGRILRDRTFFFVDYEGFHRTDGTQSVDITSVPTAFEQDNPGNISDICPANTPGNPPTNAVAGCLTPVVPVVDPTALSYFRLFPHPNRAGTVSATGVPSNNFIYNPAASQKQSLGDLRIDQHFRNSDTLFGRYSYNRADTLTPTFFPPVNGVYSAGVPNAPGPGETLTIVHNAQFAYTHIFTPSLLLELRTGYTLYNTAATPPNSGNNLNNTTQFAIPNANDCSLCSGLAGVTISSFGLLGDQSGSPLRETDENYQYSGAIIYTRGQHTFKFGSSLIRRNVSLQQALFKAGLTFTSTTAQQALVNFFHGAPFNYQRQVTLTKPYNRFWEPSVYMQDDWHANRVLTINYGVRYDVFTPANEKNGYNTNFNLNTLQEVQNPTAGIQTSYVNVAPRLGFAATLSKGLVIRGGYGLSYYASDISNALFITNAPLVFNSGVISSQTALSVTGVTPAVAQSTAQSALRGAVTSKSPNFRDAYVEQFNLLIQKELSGNVFTIGYVGELGRHLLTDLPNVNNPLPTGPSAAGAPPPPQIYATQLPNVTTINYYSDKGAASYNSLQTGVERRLIKGLIANVNYTLSHSLDDVNSGVGLADNSYGTQPAIFNRYDYGNSLLDVQSRFAGTFTYQLPFGRSGSSARRNVVGGFQINGLGFWQTGQPTAVSSTYTQNGLAQINLKAVITDRPDRIAPMYAGVAGGPANFFNAGAFARQALGTAGNAGRDQLRGPSFRRGDLSLLKEFQIHDALKGQFRVEAFNITNTPNFALPNSNITAYSTVPDANGRFEATNAGGFGSITSTSAGSAGRQFQFALKLLF